MDIIYGNTIEQIMTTSQLFLHKKKVNKTFDYEDIDLNSIITELNQSSLFGDQDNNIDYYVINNASFLTEKTKKMTTLIEQLLKSNKQILCLVSARAQSSFNNVLDKKVNFIKAHNFNETNKLKFVNELMDEYQINFDCDTTKNAFITKLSNNPNFIINEIEKIANFSFNSEVSLNDVNNLSFGLDEGNIFELIKLILSNDKNQALLLFENLLKKKMQVITLIQIISSQLFDLKLQKQYLDEYKFKGMFLSMEKLGVSSYVLQQNAKFLLNTKINKINKMLEDLFNMEMKIKNNIIVPNIAFKLFILQN